MHKPLGVIVYANSRNEAQQIAEQMFNNNEGLTEDNWHQEIEKRWTDAITVPHKATSKKGKEFIDMLMSYTKEEFQRHLREAQELVNQYSADELFEGRLQSGEHDNELGLFRYLCYHLSGYNIGENWLISWEGEFIRSQHELDNTLDKYKCIYEDKNQPNPYKNQDIWVVPFDIHY
jgi:hypothetical protein